MVARCGRCGKRVNCPTSRNQCYCPDPQALYSGISRGTLSGKVFGPDRLSWEVRDGASVLASGDGRTRTEAKRVMNAVFRVAHRAAQEKANLASLAAQHEALCHPDGSPCDGGATCFPHASEGR